MWAGRLALQHPINCSLHLLSLSSLMLFSMDLSSTAVLQYCSTNPFFQGPFLSGLWIFLLRPWEPKCVGWCIKVCIKLKSIFVTEIESVTVSAESSYSFLSWDPSVLRAAVILAYNLLRCHTVTGWHCSTHTRGGVWGEAPSPFLCYPDTVCPLPPPPHLQCGCDGSGLSDARQRYSIHGSKIICMYSLYFSSPSSQFSLSESNIAQDRPG